MTHALVLGKFYPLHAGHQALIRAAQRAADRVTVLVIGSVRETVPVDVRRRWVCEEHPQVRVVAGTDEAEIDFDSEAAWQHHVTVMRSLLERVEEPVVDLVVTSDSYGAELARRFGARWLQVDPDRSLTPVSGTAVRADPARYWWALPPSVRATLTRRVVVLGAESTGSTTLAGDLAAHYDVPWVPEFGREWSERRPGGLTAPWHSAEFDLVAAVHARVEDVAARRTASPLLVCDTDALATTVWHERYVGTVSPTVVAAAAARRPDLYLLTGDDIPFVQDGLRDGEHLRHAMQGRFREVLADQPVPWVEVHGNPEERLDAAITQVDALLARPLLGPSLAELQQAERQQAERQQR